jgi:hypothetical protein
LLPGLANPDSGFISDHYQEPGEKRFVTTDQKGNLGTTSFSVDSLLDTVGAVGALSASLGAIPQTTLLPDENLRCGIGAGAYANQWAGSFGCAVKMQERFFLNAGLASTTTNTLGGPLMGRIGFSFGFGGSPPKAQSEKLSSIPGMNGMMVSAQEYMGAGVDIPALDQSSDQGEPPVVAALRTDDSSEIEVLRDRLAELEAEIKRLNSTNIGDANQRIATLEILLEEKKESERRLLTMLSEMKSRLDDQRIMLDRLMKRMDSEAGKQSS